uniref:Uncharacterized protein n=1 Tax=Plectus sambesii TaxID=2011161 RepID=A0A914VLK9_9BILA
MSIAKLIVALMLTVSTVNAIKCWSTTSVTTKTDLGTQKDCSSNKWCAWGYSDAGEYLRGCEDDADAVCDLLGTSCKKLTESIYGNGNTICCCKGDLCNGSSVVTSSVILTSIASFILVLIAFK